MDTPDTDSVDDTGTPSSLEAGERIAKRLARAGLCSRRDAERWIADGRVAVNGQTLDSPACVVRPGDAVVVDGKPVPEPEPARLWRYHKPAGLVTTARDEKGRSTVFEKLPSDMPRVVSVGRLDLTTEGLLLLTNDGELARFLELPITGWTRRYRVRVHGTVDERHLATLAKGLTIDGVRYGPIEAELDRVVGSNAWLTVGLKEGKNREIRRVMETLGLQVTRLIRVAYGPFQLGKLDEGAVEEVPKRVVKDQLSRFFAAQGGEDAAPAKAPLRSSKPKRRTPPPPKPGEEKPYGAAARPVNSPIRPKTSARPAVRTGEPARGEEERGPSSRPVAERKPRAERKPYGRPDPYADEAPVPARGERRGPSSRPAGERKPFGKPVGREDEAPARGERRGPSSRPAGERKPFGKPVGREDEAPARGERRGPSPRPAGERKPFGKPGGREDEVPARGERRGPAKPASRSQGGKAPQQQERPQSNRASFGERLTGERPAGERPAGGKPGGGRPPRRDGGGRADRRR